MTDGRIPGKWISEPRFAEMKADTWCVLTKAITWSNEAGTDGLIKRRYLSIFHPDGSFPDAYAELVEMGIWQIVADGYQFVDWAVKPHQGGLGQSSAEQVRTHKAQARERQRKFRAKATDAPVTGDVTDSVTRDVGQDTTGQDTLLRATTSETQSEVIDWPVAVPGQPGKIARAS
jgi:hypothetical protein